MADEEQGVLWGLESARRIAAVVYRVEAMARELLGQYQVRSSRGTPLKWRPAINSSSEEIPGWGLVAIDGSTTLDSVKLVQLHKPSTTFRRLHGAIGPEPVEPGGLCAVTTEPVWVLCDGNPAAGVGMGPKPDSFKLWEHYPEVATVLQVVDTDKHIAEVDFEQLSAFYGKVNGNYTKGQTGNMTIWAGTFGSESSTGIVVSGVGFPASNMTLNDWVNVGFMHGHKEGYPRSC